MKKILSSVLGPLTIGIVTGFSALYLGAYAYSTASITSMQILESYFDVPWIVVMNLVLPVITAYFFYFIFSRLWISSLLNSLLVVGIAVVNYYKIMLRSDPLLFADVKLFRTGIAAGLKYSLPFTDAIKIVLVAAILMTVIFLIFRAKEKLKLLPRLIFTFVFIISGCLSVNLMYFSSQMSLNTTTNLPINQYNALQVYVSRGCIYPFIKSAHNMNMYTPEDYDKKTASEYYEGYEDSEITEDKQVNVIVVQLEAFTDFSEFEKLGNLSSVNKLYKKWHDFCNQSVSGHIIDNVLGGGTTTTEWNFLTGYSQFNDFRGKTESYVRYFGRQGYTSHFFHPGNNWYYYRNDVNEYLGFDESCFSEGGFEKDVSAFNAMFNSDSILIDYILEDFNQTAEPLFSFSVTYQGHGPYDSETSTAGYITTSSGLSEGSCNILNNYLEMQHDTIEQLLRLKDELNSSTKPAILLLYGDHKPWAGDNYSVYTELGVENSGMFKDKLMSLYSTPYVIWANKAAKEKLGQDFKGEGPTVSACYLMSVLFDYCGWEGPAFMQISREMRSISPIIHVSGLFQQNGALTYELSESASQFYRKYLWVQYYVQSTHIN